ALRECLSVGDVGSARTGGRVRAAHGRVLAELVSVDTGLRLQTAGVRRVIDPDPVLDGRTGIVHVLTFLVTAVAIPAAALRVAIEADLIGGHASGPRPSLSERRNRTD